MFFFHRKSKSAAHHAHEAHHAQDAQAQGTHSAHKLKILGTVFSNSI
jgi:hypothetical protein